MKTVLSLAKALSEQSRLRALMALKSGELCLCHLEMMLDLSASTTSKHMSILQGAGLVTVRKCGKWRYYGLPGKGGSDLVRGAMRWIERALSDDPIVASDARKVVAIRKRKSAGC